MIYPLLPLFLSTVLGANASFIGAIEGAAESTAALLKLASGWWSDKVKKRKPLVVIGYGIATIARPFTAIAQTAVQVLAIRVTDRVGKGIRTAPRDALLADSTDAESRGRAFGFHAAMDNAGAVLGPLIAFFLLRQFNFTLRHAWLMRLARCRPPVQQKCQLGADPLFARSPISRSLGPRILGPERT